MGTLTLPVVFGCLESEVGICQRSRLRSGHIPTIGPSRSALLVLGHAAAELLNSFLVGTENDTLVAFFSILLFLVSSLAFLGVF